MKQTPLASLALLSVLALLPLTGCAGGMFRQNSSATLGQPAPPTTIAQRIGNAFRKTGEALTPKPWVVPADDPLMLSSKPKKVSPDVYVQAAQLFEQKGDVNNAIAQFKQALALDANNLKALLGLARLYDRTEDFAKATETYERALQAHPNHAVVLNDLGMCYARQGDVNRSLDALSKAVDADPNSTLYRNNLATILIDRGLPKEALRHFVAANGEAAGNYNVGLLLYKQGNAAEAVPYLRRAAELDPSLESARALLARIQPGSTQQANATQYPANPAGFNGQAAQRVQQPARTAQASPPAVQTSASSPQYYAPVVSPSEAGASGASSPAASDVRLPQLGQFAPYGEAQAPPQPDQYGGSFQPTAFPRQLPPVQ